MEEYSRYDRKGNITRRDIVDVFPFSNTIVTKELTGAQIKNVLEHGVKLYPEKVQPFASRRNFILL